MINLNQLYSWEIELSDGTIVQQYSEAGEENSSKALNADKVVRVTFNPILDFMPKHNVIIDINKGERFISRFGRGFIKMDSTGQQNRNYLFCVRTSNYSFWLFANGGVLTGHRDLELYL